MTTGTKQEYKAEQNGYARMIPMFRFVMDSLALASVAGFVWMVCEVTQFVA